jgi:AraC-like DNA-binding protein
MARFYRHNAKELKPEDATAYEQAEARAAGCGKARKRLISHCRLRMMARMSRPLENLLTFRSLYDSPLVSVRDYRCLAGCGAPGDEEQPDADQIVLLRYGAFRKHFGRRSVTADVNQAVFFSKKSSYRVSHPADCGDRGTVFVASPRVLNDIIRELDPTIDDHPERPFPFVTGPCASGVFRRHRELARRLWVVEDSHMEPLLAPPDPWWPDPLWPDPLWPDPLWPDPLWIEVTALQIIADALETAFERQGEASPSCKRRREGTEDDHADHVEAAKAYLASRMSERVTLGAVAQAVGASPFHLARLFRRRTGAPVHRYLMCLRLRASLERLADGANDLTALALELGFSSHSHFTDSFRREFGRTPSDVRRGASLRGLREMSKNLEV